MLKKSIFLILAIILVLSASACSKSGPTEDENSKVVLDFDGIVHGSGEGYSSLYAVKGTNGADSGVEALISLMEEQGLMFYQTASQPHGLIAKEDVVLLKFNCQWAERGGTNTDLIKSVIVAITSHPEGFAGEVIVADNGQAQHGSTGRGGSIEWPWNNALDSSQTVKEVAEGFAQEHNVSALTWDGITTKQVEEYASGDYEDGFIVSPELSSTGYYVSYPKFTTAFGTHISFKEGIWDKTAKNYNSERLKVINMPVLKSHTHYQVTGCIKNYMGTVSDKLTNGTPHRSVSSGGMGTQMASTRMPLLNILDAIWINPIPRSGPMTPYYLAAETNVIAASTDPAALDYWAVKNILMAAAEQLGINGYDTMNPDYNEPGRFGYWLEKSREEIVKGGYSSTIEPTKINVYVKKLE